MKTPEELREKLSAVSTKMRPALQHLALCEKAARTANEQLLDAINVYCRLDSEWAMLKNELDFGTDKEQQDE